MQSSAAYHFFLRSINISSPCNTLKLSQTIEKKKKNLNTVVSHKDKLVDLGVP